MKGHHYIHITLKIQFIISIMIYVHNFTMIQTGQSFHKTTHNHKWTKFKQSKRELKSLSKVLFYDKSIQNRLVYYLKS